MCKLGRAIHLKARRVFSRKRSGVKSSKKATKPSAMAERSAVQEPTAAAAAENIETQGKPYIMAANTSIDESRSNASGSGTEEVSDSNDVSPIIFTPNNTPRLLEPGIERPESLSVLQMVVMVRRFFGYWDQLPYPGQYILLITDALYLARRRGIEFFYTIEELFELCPCDIKDPDHPISFRHLVEMCKDFLELEKLDILQKLPDPDQELLNYTVTVSSEEKVDEPSFHRFPDLPTELRLKIWRLTFPTDKRKFIFKATPETPNQTHFRNAYYGANPIALRVNHESRDEAMTVFKILFYDSKGFTRYFNPFVDVIALDGADPKWAPWGTSDSLFGRTIAKNLEICNYNWIRPTERYPESKKCLTIAEYFSSVEQVVLVPSRISGLHPPAKSLVWSESRWWYNLLFKVARGDNSKLPVITVKRRPGTDKRMLTKEDFEKMTSPFLENLLWTYLHRRVTQIQI
ncbi:hypothetical protein G7Y89_g6809 [Cudoniella acicularis]|uniref:2EXR domain-containing protein n=1 Tax=Cudoniella acicularis TaxID=354080 RepID=A0A8H4RM01_9HELO|nr:hypothetical protein G7Y89_g6809 [Cudoniella acicularis]